MSFLPQFIVAFTDHRLSRMRLSENRASSVRDFLVKQGIVGSSIASRGFGESQPVATNNTSAGRQQNRRVELVVSGDAIGNSSGTGIQPKQIAKSHRKSH